MTGPSAALAALVQQWREKAKECYRDGWFSLDVQALTFNRCADELQALLDAHYELTR